MNNAKIFFQFCNFYKIFNYFKFRNLGFYYYGLEVQLENYENFDPKFFESKFDPKLFLSAIFC